MARQQFLYLRRIEVQAVYHVPEIGFLVTVTALRFKPVGVDAVVVGKHLHPDWNVIRVPYQVFHYVRIVPAVNLVPDCILMFIEKGIDLVFVKVVEYKAFFFQLFHNPMNSFIFRIAIPFARLFPQAIAIPPVQTFPDDVKVVVKVVVIIRPYQRVGWFHEGFHEIQRKRSLFFHFSLPVYGRVLFPVHTVINDRSDLPAASVLLLPIQFFHYLVIPFLYHLRLTVEVKICGVPVTGTWLSAALSYCRVNIPVNITNAE